MPSNRRTFSRTLLLTFGLLIGWGLSALPRPQSIVQAHAGDRWENSILTTGPVLVRSVEGRKIQLSQDALYYLDHNFKKKTWRLVATVPSFQQSFGPPKLIDSFATRDLIEDFKIDLDRGARPKFLMTTGAIGTYSEGWSPLFVIESTTNQIAAYKVQQQTVGAVSVPKFELVEIHPMTEAPPQAALR
ncbi:hypothetical protein ACYOEI_01365 [Singulisphaera rosea]